MAYMNMAGETDNEILTEDNWNSALGTDRGYQSEWFFVNWEHFTLDQPGNDGDTMVILFTGIGAETGNSGETSGPIDIQAGFEEFPGASWGLSSHPSVPTGITPICIGSGIVHLSWSEVEGASYRLYRSALPSGAANGASNGRYQRIVKDLTHKRYRDSTATASFCWYLLVAEKAGELSGHSVEISVDASVATDAAPPVPAILSPPSGADISGLDSLVWSAVTDPDSGDMVTYILEIDDDSSFLSPEVVEEGIDKAASWNSYISVILKELSDYTCLIPGTTYYWQVEALDNHGVGSGFTPGEHSFYYKDDPPQAIDDLVIQLEGGCRPSGGNIYLSWTEPGDDSGVDYYIICRGCLPDQNGDSLACTAECHYLDTGAAGDCGVNYCYTVRAVDVTGNVSPPSNGVGEFDNALLARKSGR